MHIAVVTGPFPVASKTFILNQITGIIDAGHEVTILARPPEAPSALHEAFLAYELDERLLYWTDRPPGELGIWAHAQSVVEAGVGQVVSNLRRSRRAANRADHPWTFRLIQRVVRASAAPEFDAIICHFGNVGRTCQVLRESQVLRGPLVTVFHGYDMSSMLREKGEDIYDQLLERGDLFLPVSDHWRQKLIDMGAPREKTVVHHMGIDPERFSFRTRTSDDGEGARILSVARLVEKKGIEYGIRAFAEVAESAPKARYTIIGDGVLRGELEALATRLGIDKRVEFCGWREREGVQKALASHDILLAPSVTASDGDMEGIPVALMEAMATGLVVVSSRHSGIPELVRHGDSGLLADERDVEELVAHLRDLLEAPSSWQGFGRRARKVVEEEFAVDALNERLLELLEERFGSDGDRHGHHRDRRQTATQPE